MRIDQKKKIILEAINKKFNFLKISLKDNKLAITPLKQVLKYFDSSERMLLEEILKLKPWFKTHFFGYNVPRIKFRIFRNEVYFRQGKKIKSYPQYLPLKVAYYFLKMKRTMKKDIDKKIILESGYRSAGYQLLVFVQELVNNNFDLNHTLKVVNLPGYSEHNDPYNTAIDILTENGIPLNKFEVKKFIKTKEYKWLIKNAHKFNFFQSYPPHNPFFIFEPWHWRFFNV